MHTYCRECWTKTNHRSPSHFETTTAIELYKWQRHRRTIFFDDSEMTLNFLTCVYLLDYFDSVDVLIIHTNEIRNLFRANQIHDDFSMFYAWICPFCWECVDGYDSIPKQKRKSNDNAKIAEQPCSGDKWKFLMNHHSNIYSNRKV